MYLPNFISQEVLIGRQIEITIHLKDNITYMEPNLVPAGRQAIF